MSTVVEPERTKAIPGGTLLHICVVHGPLNEPCVPGCVALCGYVIQGIRQTGLMPVGSHPDECCVCNALWRP
jgi:hypothetical protein